VDTLKRSQEMLRQQTELLNQAHEPIIMWEFDGDISYWNKAAEDTYGFTRDQALGRKAHELLLAAPALESYREELSRQGHWTGELVHTRRDGQKIIVESRMVVVTDTEGRRLVVQADRAITERKESERILRRLADDLVAADRNKDEFLAMLGHELRTPLAPLRNVVSLLRSDAVSRAEKGRALDIMERQISTMVRLIDDLLDVSRVTLSQIELRKTRLDLVALTRDVVEQNMTYFAARDQTLQVSVPPRPVYIEADRVRFGQILSNLLHNASKYTQRGGEISVTVEEPAMLRDADTGGSVPMGEVLIRVKDNGIGIPADKLRDIFNMFMRATRSIDADQGGLGLGLTLVKRLIELHGGRIDAYSEGPGRGSEFVVRVPSAGDSSESTSPSGTQADSAGVKTLRIVVVDDNADVRESMASVLEVAGHEVAAAESAGRALELAREFRPDVMMIDLSMPDADGYELARRLRQSTADGAMLVAVSGYGHSDARERARAAGFDAYLVKPAGVEDLNRVLAQRAARRASGSNER
jgi:two-component system CheB/CheR fusion protein